MIKNKLLNFVIPFFIISSITVNSHAQTLEENKAYQEMYDNESMSHYQKGRILYNKLGQKNIEEALNIYDQGLAINKKNPLLYAGKSEALFLLLMYKTFKKESNINLSKIQNEVFRNATFAVDIAPNLSESHRSLALGYYLQNRKDEAIEEIKKAYELNKLDPENNLWYWHLIDGNNTQNNNLLLSYSLMPNNPLTNMLIAMAYDKKKDWNREDQFKYMKTSIDNSPDNDLAYLILSIWNINYKHDNDMALKNAQKSIEIDNNNPFAYFIQGIVYSSKKDKLKSEESFKKACETGVKEGCEALKINLDSKKEFKVKGKTEEN